MRFDAYTQGGTGTFTLSGAVDGTNTLFTLPVIPTRLQVYRNGVFQTDELAGLPTWDISWASNTVVFGSDSIPQSEDVLVGWVYIG